MDHLIFVHDNTRERAPDCVRRVHYFMSGQKAEELGLAKSYKVTVVGTGEEATNIQLNPNDTFSIFVSGPHSRVITKEQFLTLTVLINNLQTNEVKVPDIVLI